MSILNKLSIVIPSYNRQEYLLRNLSYWSGKASKIYALDGSKEKISDNQISRFESNINYIHNPVLLVKRIESVLSKIDTPYVSMLSDDEFFLPTSLEKSISELENDPELIACMGRAMGFWVDESGEIKGALQYPEFEDYKIDENTPGERILKHFQNYTPSMIYAVVRSDIWKKSFHPYIIEELPIYAIGEIQFELAASYLGKSKIIPYLHWLRSLEQGPITNSQDISLNRENTIQNVWLDSGNHLLKKHLLNTMSSLLSTYDNRSKNLVRSEIIRAIDVYVANNQLKIAIEHLRSTIDQFKNAIDTYFTIYQFQGPKINLILIKAILSIGKKQLIKFQLKYSDKKVDSLNTIKSKNSVEVVLNLLKEQGVYINYDELNEIKDYICEFYVKNEE